MERNDPKLLKISGHRQNLAGGFDLESLPPDTLLNTEQAAKALGLKPSTLAVWRCTGRYGLRYIKCGRLPRYRAADLLTWLNDRSRLHSGE